MASLVHGGALLATVVKASTPVKPGRFHRDDENAPAGSPPDKARLGGQAARRLGAAGDVGGFGGA